VAGLVAASAPVEAARHPAPIPVAPSTSAWLAKHFAVERQVLPNGLVLLMHEDHSVPTVTFWQWFKVGSRNERPGITGMSHFFEHMMFNGSKNVAPKEYDRVIESNGGASNAFTDRDMTAYYEDIASDRLEVLFRLDSDRMRGLRFDPELLQSEIEVVKEERRLRIDNDVAGMLDEQLYATAFSASPYGWPVLGRVGDLSRIQRDEMEAYFRTYYAPDNCILVLTGDFDSKVALALVQKYFGDIPAQPAPPVPASSEPEQQGERRVEVRYPAENVSLQIGYKAPGFADPDRYVLDVLSTILSDGESSRLYQALVHESQLALDADTFFSPHLEPGLFEFSLELRPGKTAAEGEAVLQATLDRLIREGPGADELEKARNLLEAGFVRTLKTNNGVGQQLAFHEHVFGDYRAMFRALEEYRRVTADDCRRVAKKYFDAAHRTVAVLVPTDEAGTKP
jgi:predicted Zn-dependent peptidase